MLVDQWHSSFACLKIVFIADADSAFISLTVRLSPSFKELFETLADSLGNVSNRMTMWMWFFLKRRNLTHKFWRMMSLMLRRLRRRGQTEYMEWLLFAGDATVPLMPTPDT